MRGICAALAVAGAVFLGACGSQGPAQETGKEPAASRPPRNLTVTLDGAEGPENVGILMAQQRGYFADASLSVSIFSPVLPARPVSYVVTKQDDLGVAQQPQLALASAKGAPIIAVGSLVHQPSAALIWLKKSHIGGIAGLKGKTIAIPGIPFQKKFLENLLASHGLTMGDVKVKSVGYGTVPALVGGRADAIFGSSNLEGVELEARGAKPVVARLQRLGVPPYDEFNVIARDDLVEKDPRLVQDFMSAVARGTAAAIEDPGAAVKAIEEAGLGGSHLSRKTLEAQVAATLPLLSKSGYMYPEESIRLTDWMRDQGMMAKSPRPPELLTDEFSSWQP
jgi:putative hydroxymethylpyrimidine transport system substrate-binding protein